MLFDYKKQIWNQVIDENILLILFPLKQIILNYE